MQVERVRGARCGVSRGLAGAGAGGPYIYYLGGGWGGLTKCGGGMVVGAKRRSGLGRQGRGGVLNLVFRDEPG
jgi:hypothetical protein